jgi:hypothetical protein
MNPLMPFQVMVSVEALWALITFEWAIVMWCGLWWVRVIAVHVLEIRSVTTIEVHEASRQAAH